ncbi:MAG: L-histidine N(alpha)-methyltransferase [Oscillospiraceae bacterium]|nr:L-histidine N(alpha)-methyltransferase [Oscillospiraceae bacterium]
MNEHIFYKNAYALIIGIGKYDSDKIGNLRESSKDARKFYEHLKSVGGYNTENLMLLQNKAVTKTGIIEAYNKISLKIDDESTLIFFFAGHGEVLLNENYCLPLYAYSPDNENSYLPESTIVEIFNDVKANNVLFLFDCCSSGVLARGDENDNDDNNGLSQDLIEKLVSTDTLNKGRVLIASSLPEQPSWEIKEVGGIFTHCLLNGLCGDCKKTNKQSIHLLDLIGYLMESVPETAIKYQRKQKPCVKTSILNADFPVCLPNVFDDNNNNKLHKKFITIIRSIEENWLSFEEKFAECLENKQLESRFAYRRAKVTQKYIELLHSTGYTLFSHTTRLLEENVTSVTDEALNHEKTTRLISLGVGDGTKDAIIINEFLKKTRGVLEYWIIDISEDMIKAGVKGIQQKLSDEDYERLDLKIYQWDFMDLPEIAEAITKDKRNLFFLLGNTLGNFPEASLLSKINKVMKKGDLFLIDNQLKREGKLTKEEENELKQMYGSSKHRDYIGEILKQASITIPKDGKILPRVHYDTSEELFEDYRRVTIAQEFHVNSKRTVKLGERDILLTKGRILVLYSNKYTKSVMIRLLEEQQFKIVNEPFYYKESYGLFLVTK